MASSASAIKAGSAYVELFLKDNALVAGLRAVTGKLKAVGASIGAVGAGMLASLVHIPSLQELASMSFSGPIEAFVHMGDELAKMSQRTGVGVEALSELGYAAGQSGTSIESVEAAIGKMQRAISSGGPDATKALRELGLPIAEIKKLKPEDQFQVISEHLAKIPNATDKSRIAMELFGKGGRQLLPMIANLAELREEARALGLSITDEDAKNAEGLGDAWDRIKKSLGAVKFAIGAALGPDLIEMLNTVLQYVTVGVKWVQQNRELAKWIVVVGGGLVGVGVAIAGFGVAASVAAMAVGGLIVAAKVVAVGLAAVALIAAHGVTAFVLLANPLGMVLSAVVALGVGIVGLAGYFLYTSGAGGKAVDFIRTKLSDLAAFVLPIFRGIFNAIKGGDLGLAWEIVVAGMKVAWLQGTAWIMGQWDLAVNWIIARGERIAELLGINITSLSKIWTAVTDFMASQWNGMVEMLSKGWSFFMNYVKTSIALLQKAAIFAAAIGVGPAAAAAQKAAVGLGVVMNEIGKDAQNPAAQGRQGEREKAAAAAAAERDKGIEDAKAALQGALGRADEAAAGAARPEKVASLPESGALGGKQGVTGTFSAAAIQGISGMNAQERTANATEKTADRLADLLRIAQKGPDGGLVFG